MKKGFSLVELLLSLIIISCIIAAFAPVMTKKMKNTLYVSRPSDKYEELLLNHGNSAKEGLYNCKKSLNGRYTKCTFQVPEGVNSISAVLVGGGGGGAGGVSHKTEHVIDETTYDNRTKSIVITPYMTNFKIKYIVASGGRGGNPYNSTGYSSHPNVDFCKNANASYIPTVSTIGKSGICITNYNAGDINGPSISDINRLNIYDTCPKNSKCCWGNGISQYTATKCTNNDTKNNYSGCYRTVCNWDAAKDICAKYNGGGDDYQGFWRLATYNEINDIKNIFYSLFSGNNSTNFMPCDGTSSSLYFESCTTKMPNVFSYLGPSYIWGTENDVVGYHPYVMSLKNGFLNISTRFEAGVDAASVRCIYSNKTTYYYSGGGAGAAGAVLKDIEIPASILEQSIGGKIYINSNINPFVTIEDSSANLVWGYKAYKGSDGKNGGYALGGGNPADLDKKCEFFNGSNWVEQTCEPTQESSYIDSMKGEVVNKPHKWSEMGNVIGKDNGEEIIAHGGKSFNLNIRTLDRINVGNGGNGADACYSGLCSRYGEPHNSYVRLEYDVVQPGMGSLGGDGACAARIENVRVQSGTIVDIQIGAGGNGGYIGQNGYSGSPSYITYLNTFRFGAGAGAGGTLKTSPDDFSGGLLRGINRGFNNCDTTNDKLLKSQEKNVIFKYSGAQSKFESSQEGTHGAPGGLSGFFETQGFPYTEGGCGGYYTGACINNQRNGLSAPVYNPLKLYSGDDYGTLGSGGGGGGWLNDMTNPQPAGVGGKGLDGFVYLYWKKNI